jgi:hypothetical protein
MENASTIAVSLSGRLGPIGGSPCFWGIWFGRPMDCYHKIVEANADANRLTLKFDQGEELSVFEPRGFEFSGNGFTIRRAQKVIWSWISCRKAKGQSTDFVWCFEDTGLEIDFKTSLPMQAFQRPHRDQCAVTIN